MKKTKNEIGEYILKEFETNDDKTKFSFGGKSFDIDHVINYAYNTQGEDGRYAINGVYLAIEYFSS
jgi:hypothetical protein